MTFEQVFEHVGVFGSYQKRVFHMVCLVCIPIALHTMVPVFMNANTDHHCEVQSLEYINCSQWELTADECETAKLRVALPEDMSDTPLLNETACRIRDISPDAFSPYLNSSDLETFDVIHCDRWVYDRSQYKTTIVQEFNLVCEDSHMVATSWTIYFVGVMVGSFMFGNLADFFGRKPTFFFGIVLQLISELIVAFSPTLAVFLFFRFMVGLADTGIYLIGFVIVTEFVSVSKRAMAGSVFIIYWAIGYMVMALFAYLIRDWRTLTIAVTVSSIPQLLMYPFVPESAQWLNSQGRKQEAIVILKKIAASNNKEVTDGVLDEILGSTETAKEHIIVKRSFIELFRHPNLRKKTLILIYCWLVNSCIYYGLSFGTSDLGVNDYLAAAMSGFVELPAYLLIWLALRHVGRPRLLSSCLVAGGMCCFLNIWIPVSKSILRLTCAMLGKFFITGSFSLVYIFSAELFPTIIRSVGMGTCSTFARIGGMIAPQLLFFSKLWRPLPSTVFSTLVIISGLTVLFLPETRGAQLPQTIEDGETFGKKSKRKKLEQCHYDELNLKPTTMTT